MISSGCILDQSPICIGSHIGNSSDHTFIRYRKLFELASASKECKAEIEKRVIPPCIFIHAIEALILQKNSARHQPP